MRFSRSIVIRHLARQDCPDLALNEACVARLLQSVLGSNVTVRFVHEDGIRTRVVFLGPWGDMHGLAHAVLDEMAARVRACVLEG